MNKKAIFFVVFALIIIFIAVLIGFSLKPINEKENINQSYTYMIGRGESDEAKVIVINSFYKDKCIDTRIQYTFTDKNQTKECYDNWKNVDNMTNVKILDDYTIIANTNSNNGRTKNDLKDSYTDITIEEY